MDHTEAIQRIKENIGQEAEQIIASGLGLEKKGAKYRCPNHYVHNNGDKDPSMSWYKEGLTFNCFGCGHKIDIYDYYRNHLNYTHSEIVGDLVDIKDYSKSKLKETRDTFMKEARQVKEIDSKGIDYLKLRGLTEETIEKFSLGTYKGSIAFPYYIYEQVVGYKTRKPLKDPGRPKMMSIKGSKPYLFGVQNVDIQNKELIICEGEIDCMVISQCGESNVVSIGAGAHSVDKLVEQAKEFLNMFEVIIVVSDNDSAGTDMDKKMVELLGDKVKLVDKKLYKYNDINDEYYKFGKEKVLDIIESARFRIEGRRDLDKDPYRGLKSFAEADYIPTGIHFIDERINDLEPGRVTLLTGRSNGGKTTLTKQIIAKAIDENNKVYLMNGENDDEMLLNELYTIVIGRNPKLFEKIKINRMYKYEPKKEVLDKLQVWHKGKLSLFNKGESDLKSREDLIHLLDMEMKYNNHNLIVIDNLMSILETTPDNKYHEEANFMQKLNDLSKLYRTHIVLVLHPNKTYRKGESMDFEQISGSSDLYNKADVILNVIREYDEDILVQGVDGRIEILKNRYWGHLGEVQTHFNEDMGCLEEIDLDKGEILAFNFPRFNRLMDGVDTVIPGIGPEDCPF